MREIKFKIWLRGIEKMTPRHTVSNLMNLDGSPHPSAVFLQYTGLKDINGKEIYEGDIISDWTETDEGLKQSFLQVFWDEEKAHWAVDLSYNQNKTDSENLANYIYDYSCEVTGNIYENPELLKTN